MMSLLGCLRGKLAQISDFLRGFVKRSVYHWRAVVRCQLKVVYGRLRDYDSYHFYLCYAPLRRLYFARRLDNAVLPNNYQHVLENSHRYYGLFLYPDGGLMMWYWVFGVLLGVSVYYFFPDGGGAIFLITYLFLYLFVNHWQLRKIPIFGGELQRVISPRHLPWLLQRVPSIIVTWRDAKALSSSRYRADYIIYSWLKMRRYRVDFFLLRYVKRTAPCYRRRTRRSDGEFLLRSAIGYFFNADHNRHGRNSRLLRFFLFWLAPIWLSWVALIAPFVCAAGGVIDYGNTEIKGGIVSLVLWVILSISFLLDVYRHIDSAKRWRSRYSRVHDVRGMPAGLVDTLCRGVDIPSAVSRVDIRKTISIIFSGLFLAYLTILTLLATVT